MSKKITAFTPFQMFYHKSIIILMFFFILTGLPILSPYFHWIAYCFGVPFDFISSQNGDALTAGIQVCRIVHRVAAMLFLLFSLPFAVTQLLQIAQWHIWPESGAAGIGGLKTSYIDFKHARQGKYNAGQKIAAYVFIVCIAMLAFSGFVLWFRGSFSVATLTLARTLHDIGFALLLPTLLGHMYFGIHPLNRAGFKAMFGTGELNEEEVKSHHPLWYEKIKQNEQ